MRTLETERLILRDWKMSDLDDYFKLRSNPNITIPDGDLPKKQRKNVYRYLNIYYRLKITMLLY
jgi:RimJ/RimL family protein N-acetyltransferase